MMVWKIFGGVTLSSKIILEYQLIGAQLKIGNALKFLDI